MNLQTAFEILEIDTNKISYNEINLSYLKKKYHKKKNTNYKKKT
jgi:hypothetical protein